jgi:hypothetical protein
MKLRALVLALCIITASVFSASAQEEMMMDMAGAPATLLASAAMDGTPEGIDEEAWLAANAIAFFDMAEDGTDTVTVVATNLVPEGLYTFWWVNNMEDMANMSMGPAGGAEANAFTADEDGNATFSVVVASENDYQTLVVAYHADGETHGEMPGEMGVQTFSHLMGAFPGPANMESLGYVTFLTAAAMDGTPEDADEAAWLEAAGYAYAAAPSEDMADQTEVTVLLTGLVSEGLYTFWWVNNMEDMDNMSMGPAGGVEANSFSADENGTAAVKIAVAADNDYQTLVVAFHADGETHGEMPGEMGVQTFSHLMGAFPHLTMSDGM